MERKIVTLYEWLIQNYSYDVAKRFASNLNHYNHRSEREIRRGSVMEYINYSFDWESTSEGHNFWSYVSASWHNYVYSLEKLKLALGVNYEISYGKLPLNKETRGLNNITIVFN
jgi:hypothetical protein